MPKALETLYIAANTKRTADITQTASDQLIDCIGSRMFAQVGFHVQEAAQLCRTHGLAALLAGRPKEEQDAFRAFMADLKTYWEAQSPTPFPELPETAQEGGE